MDPVRPTELIDGPSLVQIDPQREPHVLERIGDKGVETKLLIDSYWSSGEANSAIKEVMCTMIGQMKLRAKTKSSFLERTLVALPVS